MGVLENIKLKASKLNKVIVLPEGEDKRVVEASVKASNEGLAKVIVLGDEAKIKQDNAGLDLSKVSIVNPITYEKTMDYASILFKAREGKINKKTGLPEYADVESAKASILKDYTMYAALMLKAGDADGLVSGA
ncbi:MAG: phosphate acetyltransferase, partial [Clostridia bacterium]|nr:phosphate acetyltransferase [Clostridia bacterium]